MRKIVFFIFSFFFLSKASLAWGYEAHCLFPGEKFKACHLDVLDDVLRLRFVAKEDLKFDRDISKDKIVRVTSGESAKKDMMKTFVLGPLMFFSLFDRSPSDRDVFGIEYLDTEDQKKSLFIRLKKDEGYVFGTSLRKMSGQKIHPE